MVLELWSMSSPGKKIIKYLNYRRQWYVGLGFEAADSPQSGRRISSSIKDLRDSNHSSRKGDLTLINSAG